jgi:hypothetical protein
MLTSAFSFRNALSVLAFAAPAIAIAHVPSMHKLN